MPEKDIYFTSAHFPCQEGKQLSAPIQNITAPWTQYTEEYTYYVLAY